MPIKGGSLNPGGTGFNLLVGETTAPLEFDSVIASPQQETQTLSPDALIDLLEIDLNPIGIPITDYFCRSSQLNDDMPYIEFSGIRYKAWPIKLSGFASNAKGALPKPKIDIANINGAIAALLVVYQPYEAVVRRRMVYRRHLDDGADPNQDAQFEPQEYILNRWERNDINCVLHLATELEKLNAEIPSRRIIDLRTGE